jgi:nucleotide-binding universal stress UspA family protein
MFEHILICLDGSQLAEQILPYATEQAVQFRSKVKLLQVMTIPGTASMTATAGAYAQTGILEEEYRKEETEVKTYLEKIAQSLTEQGIDTELNILRPAPAGEAIVSFAQDNNIDLICMATHGRSGIKRAVLGSVADHVLRESGLPVLIMKPKEIIT